MSLRSACSAAIVIACSAATSGAVAAEPDSPYAAEEAVEENEMARKILFDEAKPLIKRGRCDEALPVLDRSLRLYRSPYTLTIKARCLNKLGRFLAGRAAAKEALKLVTEELKRASGRRAAAKKLVARDAEQLLTAAVQGVSRITLMVPSTLRAQSPEVSYRLLPEKGDEREAIQLSEDEFDSPVEIDPGRYRIAARAAGLRPWSTELVVPTSGDHVAVVLPELAGAGAVDEGLPPLRVAAVALAIPGFASILAGAATGLATLSLDATATTGELGKIRDFNAISAGLSAGGAALVTVGAALWLLGEPAQAAPVAVGIGPASARLRVRF